MSHRLAPTLGAAAFLALPALAPAGCSSDDGVVTGAVTVEAQQRSEWALYSFEADDVLRDGDGAPLLVADPSAEEGWDLAISQWLMATNSGDSASPGSVSRGALLAVEGDTEDWASLESFTARCSDFGVAGSTTNEASFGCSGTTPTVDDGYVSDVLDDPDGAGPFPQKSHNSSLSFWFEYEFSGHTVIPYGHVYVVETNDGRCVKLQLTDYYDAEGESGFISFNWDWLAL